MDRLIVVVCFLFTSIDAQYDKIDFLSRMNPAYWDGRVVGGVPIDITKAPYQVAIENAWAPFCGGSLISDTHVITAAHCLSNLFSSRDLKIRVGTADSGMGGTTYMIRRFFLHPEYNDETLEFDVAVLELAIKVTFNEKVKSIPLADAEPEPNTFLMISGWGLTKHGGDESPILLSTELKVLRRDMCKDIYKADGLFITERMFCGFMLDKGPCKGDSGGPAVSDGKLAGVISWNVRCADPYYPGVYTNLADSKIRAFINLYANL